MSMDTDIDNIFNSYSKEQILSFVKDSNYFLLISRSKWIKDKDVVLSMIKLDSSILYYTPFKDDKNVVLTAVKYHGLSLRYASDELKSNKELVLAAVMRNGESIQYASEALQNDKDIALATVTNNGDSLRFLSMQLRRDKSIILAAVTQNSLALKHASLYVKTDLSDEREIFLTALETSIRTNQPAHKVFQQAPEDFQKDKEFVLKFVKADGFSLFYANAELKQDKEIVLEAVRQNPLSLYFADTELQNDIDYLKMLKNVKMETQNLFVPYKTEINNWYEEKMKILAILEDEEWMKENNPQASSKHKTRKF